MNKSKVLKSLTDARAYKRLTTIDQDTYSDEWWRTGDRRTKNSVKGSKNHWCWKRKEIYHFQKRMYRTWKYNRKTKWK